MFDLVEQNKYIVQALKQVLAVFILITIIDCIELEVERKRDSYQCFDVFSFTFCSRGRS